MRSQKHVQKKWTAPLLLAFVRAETCFSGKNSRAEVDEHLVDFERSEKIYLVTCDHINMACGAFFIVIVLEFLGRIREFTQENLLK